MSRKTFDTIFDLFIIVAALGIIYVAYYYNDNVAREVVQEEIEVQPQIISKPDGGQKQVAVQPQQLSEESMGRISVVQSLMKEYNNNFVAEQPLEFGSKARQTQHIKSFAIFNVLAEAYRALTTKEKEAIFNAADAKKIVPRNKRLQGVALVSFERELTSKVIKEQFEVFLTSFADIDYMGMYKVNRGQIEAETRKTLKSKGLLIESK